MKTYTLSRKQFLPISLQEAWSFFSDPSNLSKITPGDMGFTIVTDLKNKEMHEGLLIEYRVRPLMNIPMKWVTKIGKVQKPLMFVDTQLKGPYALWEHTHTFEITANGVNMTDEVKYALPMGFLGDIAHVLFVKKRLNDIFNFRKTTLDNFFSKK